MSAREELIHRLKAIQAGSLATRRQALEVLQAPYPQGSQFTLAGAILNEEFEGGVDSILWTTVELGVRDPSAAPKAERMLPIATLVSEQQKLLKHHARFFDIGHEKVTEDWLTASLILDICQLHKFERVVIAMPNQAGRLINSPQSARLIAHNNEHIQLLAGELKAEWKGEGLWFIGRLRRFAKFANWLQEIEISGKRPAYYLAEDLGSSGREIFGDARLYVALDENARIESFDQYATLSRLIHDGPILEEFERIFPAHPLDTLWSETSNWFSNSLNRPHNMPKDESTWKADLLALLEKFLGPCPESWRSESAASSLHEAVKTLCGVKSCCSEPKNVVMPTNPISVPAAVLLFLMGVHLGLSGSSDTETSERFQKAKEIDWSSIGDTRYSNFLPRSDFRDQRRLAKLVFDLGTELAIAKETGKCGLCGAPYSLRSGMMAIPLSWKARHICQFREATARKRLVTTEQVTHNVLGILSILSSELRENGGTIGAILPGYSGGEDSIVEFLLIFGSAGAHAWQVVTAYD